MRTGSIEGRPIRVIRCKLLVHPTQIDHAVDLPDQMIRRHYLVEIKHVKELPLSTLSPPHHAPLPRITSQSDGITVRPWSQREFCNTFRGKADIVSTTCEVCHGPARSPGVLGPPADRLQ